MGLLILLAVAVVAVVLAIRFMPETTSKFHPSALSLQALMTVLIAVLAAYWYLIERKGMPHATVELSATGVRLDERTALIQARVEVENSGHVVLRPPQWDVRLLSIVPSLGAPSAAAAAHARRGVALWPDQLAGAWAYYNGEMRWTVIRQFLGPAVLEIEPGERDVKTFDIFVSCELVAARLTVALRKPDPAWWQRSAPEGGWWWSDRLTFGLADVCAAPIGTVHWLEPEGEDEDEEEETGR